MMKIFAALFFAALFPAAAQTPQVPHKMEFAGITLVIRDDARREIQKDVDALTQSPRHYNIKAERAKTYFPIIEKIFAEEQVPDDFKYLSLQESALIADAVSSSNAVGFWQFKDFTAIEMGLRVDKEIDERLNIVSSSRAAARYIKKNNTFFDNWVYALQAYQMGAGGVMKTVKDNQSGATRMEINSHTYWYVKKFLAHKVAYEPGVKGKGQVEVLAYQNNNGKSLASLAKEISVDEEELRNYNKWSKKGTVPADRTYVVLVPLTGSKNEITLPSIASHTGKPEPRITPPAGGVSASAARKKVNGIQAVQAQAGESAQALASRAGIELTKFLKWNDLSESQPLIPGQFYFLARKRVRAVENFHKLAQGESLWLVSQRYGVQLKKLRRYNRLSADEEAAAGTMLWLASTRPRSESVQKPVENAVSVSNEEVFNWQTGEGVNAAPERMDTVTPPAERITPPVQEVVTEPEPEAVQKPSDSVKILQEPVITDTSVLTEADPGPQQTETVPVARKATHTVQPKETLYGIARMYNIGVMDLVNWNNLDLQQGIKPGQVLKLTENQPVKNTPAPPSKTALEMVHEVKSSDTLYSIARQYGVTIKEIMDWNEKKDFSLAVGEKLKIHQR